MTLSMDSVAYILNAFKVFDMLMDGSPLTKKVMTNTRLFREKMTQAGFNIIVRRF